MNRWFGDGTNHSTAEVDAKIAEAEAVLKQAEQQLSFANNPEYSNRVDKALQVHEINQRLDQLQQTNRENAARTAERDAERAAQAQEVREAQERAEAQQRQAQERAQAQARQEHAAFKASLFGKSTAELDDLKTQTRATPTARSRSTRCPATRRPPRNRAASGSTCRTCRAT